MGRSRMLFGVLLVVGACAGPNARESHLSETQAEEGTLLAWAQQHPEWAVCEVQVPTGRPAEEPATWRVTALYADQGKAAEGTFVDQKAHGTFVYWSPDGEQYRHEEWAHGRLVRATNSGDPSPAVAN